MQFVIQPRSYDDPDVTRMIAEVQAEYVQRYGGPDAAAVDPAEFAPPEGLFLVGLLHWLPVTTGGWRRMEDGRAEIKRVYPAPRGVGAGSRPAGPRSSGCTSP